MIHRNYKRLLYLTITGELSEKEKIKIQSHIQKCQECRNEYEKLEKLGRFPVKAVFLKPEEGLLERSRNELLAKIDERKIKVAKAPAVFRILRYIFVVERKTALIGFVALVFGICTGFLLTGMGHGNGFLQKNLDNSSFVVNQPQINNLKFIDTDSGGNVDFTFDEVVTLRMKGNLNESRVQTVLAHALANEQNPGVRLKTVSAFYNKKTDKIMKDAIIQTVKNDDNPGVRAQAIQVLVNLPLDEEIRDALIYVLQNDKNPGLRNAALKCIEIYQNADKNNDKKIYNTLRTKMETDDNSFIKYRAKTLLEEAGK